MERGQSPAYGCGAVREERGQTAAEFMGVLLLVGADHRRAVHDRRRREGRERDRERRCARSSAPTATPAAAGRTGEPGVGDSDLEGPPLTDHPFLVLPFPGSVTITCTYDERDPTKCMPKGGNGVSVQASGELKVERTPTTLDANGCPWQNLSIADDAEADRERRGQGRQGGRLAVGLPRPEHEVPADRLPRRRRTRSPTATARRRTRSTRARSRPARASSSPRTSTTGINAKGSYRALQVEMGYDDGHARVQRRQAHQPDDRAGDGRRLGVRAPGAQGRRRLQGRRASRWATPRTSATASCTRSTSTSPTRPAGTPTRRSWSSGKLPKNGHAGHDEPDPGRDGRVHRRDRSWRPSWAASSSAGSVNSSDGRLTDDHERRRHRRHGRDRPLRRRRPRGHEQGGRRRQPGRHRRPARCCCTTSTSRWSRASTG